jgi:hypothetical protein
MYSPFDCAWLHRDAAQSLERAAQHLAARRSDLAGDRVQVRSQYLRVL